MNAMLLVECTASPVVTKGSLVVSALRKVRLKLLIEGRPAGFFLSHLRIWTLEFDDLPQPIRAFGKKVGHIVFTTPSDFRMSDPFDKSIGFQGNTVRLEPLLQE